MFEEKETLIILIQPLHIIYIYQIITLCPTNKCLYFISIKF